MHSEEDSHSSNFNNNGTKKRQKINVNMLGVFLHIFADTLRTLAIFIAAIVSSITNIPTVVTDAYAAIIVAFSIILVAIPLLNEIILQLIIYIDEEWEDTLCSKFCLIGLKILYYVFLFGFLRKDYNLFSGNSFENNEYNLLLNQIKKVQENEEEKIRLIV